MAYTMPAYRLAVRDKQILMNPQTNTNTGLHDPLRDLAPHAAPFHPDARLLLLALLLIVLIAGIVRMRRTDAYDDDYAPRRDMAWLLGVVWLGLGVEWIRSRMGLATPGFWFASLALLPFVFGAIVLGARLFGAYRDGASAPPPSRPNPPAPKAGRR